jgi:hypothetical protein
MKGWKFSDAQKASISKQRGVFRPVTGLQAGNRSAQRRAETLQTNRRF